MSDLPTSETDTSEAEEHIARCPRCKSTNWDCWDERSMDCWNKKTGSYAGVEVAGGLKCKECGNVWLDYSVKNDDPDCECEGWDD